MPIKFENLVEVEGPVAASGALPSRGPVYRLPTSKDGFPKLAYNTLYEVFDASVTKYSDSPCLGHRPVTNGVVGDFIFSTYAETGQQVARIGSALQWLGLAPGAPVGVFGTNSPQWMVAMQACNRTTLTCVPLYDSLGEDAIEYIIFHSGASVVFTSTAKLPQLLKALKHPKVKDTLKTIIVWGGGDAAFQTAAEAQGYKVLSFEALLTSADVPDAPARPPKPSDVCTIMYTSGTTGDPKGVVLTHTAVTAVVASMTEYLEQQGETVGPSDRLLSYLPLAHIFDRIFEELFLYQGASVGYWQGDVKLLTADIAALKPTLLIGVPRVYDRIYQGVLAQVKGGSPLKRLLFNYAVTRKAHFLKAGYKHTEASPFFDKLVFSKIAGKLGGSLRLIISGGAPLAAHVEEFLKVATCSPVVQGYGLTETCAGSFIPPAHLISMLGTVGLPTAGTEFRLESVPEMSYDALDDTRPGGEVLVRSAQHFSGYFKAEDKTLEVVEKDGWFHTGDIGVLNPDGALKLVDRKKNIFKLSQGEYIAVEKVEETYKKASHLVDQVWVYGNSFKSSLVAVVVPHKATIEEYAKAEGLTGSFEELVKEEKVRKLALAELVAAGRADKLKGFEIVKSIILSAEPFTIENELLTPTFKLKRPQLQKLYSEQIDEQYKLLGE